MFRCMLIQFMCIYSVDLYAQNINDGKKIILQVRFADKDSFFHTETLKQPISFNNNSEAMAYADKLKSGLMQEGYYTASIDSFRISDNAMHLVVFAGEKYDFIIRQSGTIDKSVLISAGINPESLFDKQIDYKSLQDIQKKLLKYHENNGYPFASVSLDSVRFQESHISTILKFDKGIYYTIDSIRNVGESVVNKVFLQRYLNIMNLSAYNAEALRMVDSRLLELPYATTVQASDITMLGSSAILNTYLKHKKSSQFYILAGIQPSSIANQKSQLTADVNLDLKNLFGSGENILFKWQQLQTQSPRLNMGYVQPYIFHSGVGTEFLFDLFKKDSNFLQLNAQIGFRYSLSTKKLFKIYIQWRRFNLLEGAIDTALIIAQKALPSNIDMNSTAVGLEYEWNNTDYRFNPRSGNAITLNAQFGLKKIRKNTDIIDIKDGSYDYESLYDSIRLNTHSLKFVLSASHYFPTGNKSTVKTSCSLGYLNSPAIFRNELFQIGGYKLLRGFDEESLYATRYAVLSTEYRILISRNSYLSFFSDAGNLRYKYQSVDVANNFISAGLGILYETKAGILNLSYAMGKRQDVAFDLRSASKIHFGYINYF